MGKKGELMKALINDLVHDHASEQIFVKRRGKQVNVGLINQFALHEVIPNKWFDWVNRVHSPIMVIGQDWGPYIALKKYVEDYDDSKLQTTFDYDSFLLKTFSSRTERFIMTTIKETYQEHYGFFDNKVFNVFFFTMAVLYTRQGKHFRGSSNFDEKRSFAYSYPYVCRQIEIVKPKVIMTIGNLGFRVVNQYFKLGFDGKTLSSVITQLGNQVIRVDEKVIIPNFHPASHTSPQEQKQRWKKIWEYV